MPNQSLLYAGRVLAVSNLSEIMNLTRDLCGGQLSLTPSAAAFDALNTGDWLRKYYTVNDGCTAEDRDKLMAFARDLVSSDFADHKLAFQLNGQSPPHAHLATVYRPLDCQGPMALVRDAAGLDGEALAKSGDAANWHTPGLPKRTKSLAEFALMDDNLPTRTLGH